MLQTLKIFFRNTETRPVLILICLLLASLAEAVSIGSLLPIMAAFSSESANGTDGNVYQTFFNWIGIVPTLQNVVFFAVGLVVFKATLSFGALSYAGIAGAKVSMSFRNRLVQGVLDARWSYFAGQQSGRFANAISNDAGRAADAFISSAKFVAFFVQVAAYVVIALLINWRIALVGSACALTIALALQRLVYLSKRAGYRQTDRTSELTVLMVDMLNNIKPLKTMQRQRAMGTTSDSLLARLQRAVVTREYAKNGLNEGGDALVAILGGMGILVGYTAFKVSLAEMIVSGIIIVQIIGVASKMQKQLQLATQSESAYVRVAELLEETEANRETFTGTVQASAESDFLFENVSFAHGGATEVLRNASFKIPARRITVLSGASGSGKTTLIDLLIGLHRPKAGRVLIGKTDLSDVDLKHWRGQIGYVPQELNLFHSSIRDNVTLGDPALTDTQVLSALELAGAKEFIALLPDGLNTSVGEMGAKMSGGQRQRISLARALVTNPKILILDEVTSALDPKTEAEIVANVRSLRGSYTIVVITHRPAWTEIADSLFKVSGGVVTDIMPGARPAATNRQVKRAKSGKKQPA